MYANDPKPQIKAVLQNFFAANGGMYPPDNGNPKLDSQGVIDCIHENFKLLNRGNPVIVCGQLVYTDYYYRDEREEWVQKFRWRPVQLNLTQVCHFTQYEPMRFENGENCGPTTLIYLLTSETMMVNIPFAEFQAIMLNLVAVGPNYLDDRYVPSDEGLPALDEKTPLSFI